MTAYACHRGLTAPPLDFATAPRVLARSCFCAVISYYLHAHVLQNAAADVPDATWMLLLLQRRWLCACACWFVPPVPSDTWPTWRARVVTCPCSVCISCLHAFVLVHVMDWVSAFLPACTAMPLLGLCSFCLVYCSPSGVLPWVQHCLPVNVCSLAVCHCSLPSLLVLGLWVLAAVVLYHHYIPFLLRLYHLYFDIAVTIYIAAFCTITWPAVCSLLLFICLGSTLPSAFLSPFCYSSLYMPFVSVR